MAKDIEKKQSAKPEKTSKANTKKTEKKPKSNKLFKFFKDLKAEFKKVVWPSKKQVVNNTGVVLTTIIISGLFIWALDFGLTQLINLALKNV